MQTKYYEFEEARGDHAVAPETEPLPCLNGAYVKYEKPNGEDRVVCKCIKNVYLKRVGDLKKAVFYSDPKAQNLSADDVEKCSEQKPGGCWKT